MFSKENKILLTKVKKKVVRRISASCFDLLKINVFEKEMEMDQILN